jgi:hypothetical protein
LNSDESLGLEHFRGRVVLLHAFQMLCPGCVAQALPQAQRVAELFADKPLAVIGLHTVFEHHDAMHADDGTDRRARTQALAGVRRARRSAARRRDRDVAG